MATFDRTEVVRLMRVHAGPDSYADVEIVANSTTPDCVNMRYAPGKYFAATLPVMTN
jgi:hypothetical protein